MKRLIAPTIVNSRGGALDVLGEQTSGDTRGHRAERRVERLVRYGVGEIVEREDGDTVFAETLGRGRIGAVRLEPFDHFFLTIGPLDGRKDSGRARERAAVPHGVDQPDLAVTQMRRAQLARGGLCLRKRPDE